MQHRSAPFGGFRVEGKLSPSNVNAASTVPTTLAPIVNTAERSVGEPLVVCLHVTLEPDVQDVDAHALRAICIVAVRSAVLKFRPVTVTPRYVENDLLGLAAPLTTGAPKAHTRSPPTRSIQTNLGQFNLPSKVKLGYRVPTTEATVASQDVTGGYMLSFKQAREVTDTHAAVEQCVPSMRLLGVVLLCPKPSPKTVTVPAIVRP